MGYTTAISQDLRIAIIRMDALKVPTKLISNYTGIALRTVQLIIAIYNLTGEYGPKKERSTGSNRKLSGELIKFIIQLATEVPDCQLTDIQACLRDEKGIDVSVSTIWRALTRAGYSLKSVGLT
ncbi:Homeodomain-like protein [Serendipita vermifera]|nr:Homeodomain-like protein [Serendipita vermifera]